MFLLTWLRIINTGTIHFPLKNYLWCCPGLDCEIEPAIEHAKNQFPKYIWCSHLSVWAFAGAVPLPELPEPTSSWYAQIQETFLTPRWKPTPSLCSPNHVRVGLHRHTYPAELQLFTLRAPSLSCESPEVSDSVIFLFLSFVSRIVFAQFGHTIIVCWMDAWMLENVNWMDEWMNEWVNENTKRSEKCYPPNGS